MKQEILNNLTGFLDYARQGVEFIKDQAPLYVQELITYSTVKYTFYTICSFAVIILSIILFISGIIIGKKDADLGFPLCAFGTGIFVVSAITFCININIYWQVTYAPRVFVMEYLLKIVG